MGNYLKNNNYLRIGSKYKLDIKNVANIINTWDPIDLLVFAPKDEYEYEIMLIAKLLKETSDIEEAAKGIRRIFSERFGDDVFKKDAQKYKKESV